VQYLEGQSVVQLHFSQFSHKDSQLYSRTKDSQLHFSGDSAVSLLSHHGIKARVVVKT